MPGAVLGEARQEHQELTEPPGLARRQGSLDVDQPTVKAVEMAQLGELLRRLLQVAQQRLVLTDPDAVLGDEGAEDRPSVAVTGLDPLTGGHRDAVVRKVGEEAHSIPRAEPLQVPGIGLVAVPALEVMAVQDARLCLGLLGACLQGNSTALGIQRRGR